MYYFPCDTLIADDMWFTIHLEETQVLDVDSAAPKQSVITKCLNVRKINIHKSLHTSKRGRRHFYAQKVSG